MRHKIRFIMTGLKTKAMPKKNSNKPSPSLISIIVSITVIEIHC